MLSKFDKPRFEEASLELYKEVPHDLLAKHADDLLHIIKFEVQMAEEQQEKLRHAIIVLSVWLSVLLVTIVLGRTKALKK